MSIPSFLHPQAGGTLLHIKLQPRASADEIGQALGAELRVRVTAPPVDAAANQALVRLLAQVLDCPKNQIELVRGQTSRHKVIMLHQLTPTMVAARLAGAADQ